MKSLSVKLGVILIALIILGYGKTCNAEGAWVLWQKAEITKTTWVIEGAFPSYAVCIQNELSVCQGFASKSGDRCQSIEGQHFVLLGNGRSIGWMCLPDTIDPRK